MELAGHVDMVYPPYEVMVRARTQEEASTAATPVLTGADVDCTLHGVDLLQVRRSQESSANQAWKNFRFSQTEHVLF